MRISLLTVAAVTLLACGGSGSGSDTPDGQVQPDASSPGDAGSNQNNSGDAPAPIVDTAQDNCYGATQCLECPGAGGAMYGQDAQYRGAQPSYQDNGDGTVTDLVTGLMWQQSPGAKRSFDDAVAGAATFDLAGYDDWRLPTIKELYSLIVFSGTDPSSCMDEQSCDAVPFIDTTYFDFSYGDTSAGERLIDAQYVSATEYVSTTMAGDPTVFGVNFADGRIKGYPKTMMGSDKLFFVQYVRGASDTGTNDFVDNGDGTVTDRTTGLMWLQQDSGHLSTGALSWEAALAWCEGLTHAGHDDWRLPNVKELQSIVDYGRSPATTSSAAIDPVFQCSTITDEGGATNWPFYWSSTTHASQAGSASPGSAAAYVAFGEALGWMQQGGSYTLMDVHGAGAQRSDPKAGDPADYPYGFGPQGDVIRIYNHARCVRAGGDTLDVTGTATVCEGGTGTEVVDCVDASPGDPCCGDGQCLGAETETNCPADCGATGPTSCTDNTDCQAAGACPPDAALGCTCEPSPMGTGSFCVPNCTTDNDCPSPPDMTLLCTGGLCVPAGGP